MVKTDRRLKMENETPKYATWIPTAGGYVYDGNVVSKDPQYDEKGNFLMDVNGSAFTQSKQTTQPQVANQPTTNVGITTANTQGSAEDVNAPITGAGSLASLNNNTEQSTTGVLETNATLSPVAGVKAVNANDQWDKDYAYMVSTNNLQGQINLLTQKMADTGVDYTAQIDSLTQQREQKIRNIDDQYLAAYNEAMLAGDTNLASQILNEQLQWRDMVGYQGAMQTAKQRADQEIQKNYEYDYLTGIKEIANTVMNLTGTLLNFQYNPYTDQALLMAQGQATSRVKEQMNATGMYYSSMTASAITKACAELIPVYEKMAKQEILDNLNALQSTANFLMNLEQSQFNLWKGQIEMQYKANEEKRKEVDAAWERANMMGYIDNNASAVLGVPAGTLSPTERARLQSIQDQIAKENRALQQDITLAGYKADLEIERMREQNRLSQQYYDYQLKNPKPGDGGDLTYSQVLTTAKAMLAAGKTQTEMAEYVNSTNLTEEQKNNAINTAMLQTEVKEQPNLTEVQKQLNAMVDTYEPSEIIDKAFELVGNNPDDLTQVLNMVKYATSDTSTLSGKMFDPRSLNAMGKEAYKVYVDFYTKNDGKVENIIDNVETLVKDLGDLADLGLTSADEYDNVFKILNRDIIQNKYLDSNSIKNAFKSGNSSRTHEVIENAMKEIEKYAEAVYESNVPSKETIIADAYVKLVNKIAEAGDNFDYNWLPFNTGIKSRTEAVKDVLKSVNANKTFGSKISERIYPTLVDTADTLERSGKIEKIDTTPAIL